MLCLNLWALKRINEHWGSYSDAVKAMGGGEAVECVGELLIMLHVLLHGGAIYTAEMGSANPEPPDMAELAKLAPGFLHKLRGTVLNALRLGMDTSIKLCSENSSGRKAEEPEWLLWYGLRVGLSYREAHALPLGELLELISIEQVKKEGAKIALSEEDEFFALLKLR